MAEHLISKHFRKFHPKEKKETHVILLLSKLRFETIVYYGKNCVY